MSDPRECVRGRTPRGSGRVGIYRRRRPECTVLYEVLRQDLETWLSRAAQRRERNDKRAPGRRRYCTGRAALMAGVLI